MAHHRCTGCKQESYPRHKYHGGVYCDTCISRIRGFLPSSRRRSWLGSWWDRIVEKISGFFGSKRVRLISVKEERAAYSRLKDMQARARSIPSNPLGGAPQKR